VTVAEGPREGLAVFEEEGADVVICDIRMPEMSGLEVLRRLKASGSDVEVIMMTGYASLDSAQEALRSGPATT